MMLLGSTCLAQAITLTVRVTDPDQTWETMGYTYGMTNPSGRPLGIYGHAGVQDSKTQMIYRGLLPFGENIFQFLEDQNSQSSAISMEASIIDSEPMSQCYVTQYICGSMDIEGNCYADENDVVILNSRLEFQVEFRKSPDGLC